jgi:hypothetical protein
MAEKSLFLDCSSLEIPHSCVVITTKTHSIFCGDPWYDSDSLHSPCRRPVYGRMAAPRPRVYYRLIHRLVCYCSLRSASSLLTLAIPSHHPVLTGTNSSWAIIHRHRRCHKAATCQSAFALFAVYLCMVAAAAYVIRSTPSAAVIHLEW